MTAAIKDAAHVVDVATVMRLLPARPRLLALGEPTHGEDVLLDLRNDLFRQLVEQERYQTIAIESDCMMGLVVDDYVTSGTGTLDEVMERGFSHGFGASAANRELVRWMREYNDGRPVSERLRFAGFDGPLEITGAASPRQALTALHGYLAAHVDADLLPCAAETLDRLLGADDRWTNPAAMMDPSRSVGQSAEARELRLLADDLVALLAAQTPHLVTVTSREDWHRARLHGRTATGLLRYHFWMADTSPSRLTRLVGLRDQMMADNLRAIAERGPALVYAHNGHLQRDESTMRMGDLPLEWWSAGAIVSAHLGEGYAFLATALGTIRHQGVDTPPPDTVEGLLYALPEDRCVVDAPGWPPPSATRGPPPACPRITATSHWTRPTWPSTTGSCSSGTSRRASAPPAGSAGSRSAGDVRQCQPDVVPAGAGGGASPRGTRSAEAPSTPAARDRASWTHQASGGGPASRCSRSASSGSRSMRRATSQSQTGRAKSCRRPCGQATAGCPPARGRRRRRQLVPGPAGGVELLAGHQQVDVAIRPPAGRRVEPGHRPAATVVTSAAAAVAPAIRISSRRERSRPPAPGSRRPAPRSRSRARAPSRAASGSGRVARTPIRVPCAVSDAPAAHSRRSSDSVHVEGRPKPEHRGHARQYRPGGPGPAQRSTRPSGAEYRPGARGCRHPCGIYP